jgi:hypothetical protein
LKINGWNAMDVPGGPASGPAAGGAGGSGTLPLVVVYNYDLLDRVMTRSYIGSRWTNSEFSYDLADQLTKKELRTVSHKVSGK